MIIIPFCVTKSLAQAMTHTYTIGREREREYPLTLAPFTLITLEISRFSKDTFFLSKRQKFVKEKKKKRIFWKFYFFVMNFFN
jgi:hypothetical protein